MKLCRSVSPASRSRLLRITALALASSASSAVSMARCWRVFSKPTTPMNSPATKIGTMALVRVPTPSIAQELWPTSVLLKQTLRPARSSAHTAEKWRSSHEHTAASPRRGVTPSQVHSLTTTSSGSPFGPVRVSMILTRSTCAASPISPSTPGMAARTSDASSSRRLALAEAMSSCSRRRSDSLMRVSSSVAAKSSGAGRASVTGRPWGSSSATVAFIKGSTRSAAGNPESLPRPARDLPFRPGVSTLRGSGGGTSWGSAGRRRAPFVRLRIKDLAPGRAHVARQWGVLPASVQRLVHRHQAGRRLGARLRQANLGGQLGALGIEHVEEVDEAPLVACAGDAGGGGARLRRIGRILEARACPRVGHERILGLLQRLEHALLVAGERDVGPGAAAGDLCAHPP